MLQKWSDLICVCYCILMPPGPWKKILMAGFQPKKARYSMTAAGRAWAALVASSGKDLSLKGALYSTKGTSCQAQSFHATSWDNARAPAGAPSEKPAALVPVDNTAIFQTISQTLVQWMDQMGSYCASPESPADPVPRERRSQSPVESSFHRGSREATPNVPHRWKSGQES